MTVDGRGNRADAAVGQSTGHAVRWDYPDALSVADRQNHFSGYARLELKPLACVDDRRWRVRRCLPADTREQITRRGMSASDYQTRSTSGSRSVVTDRPSDTKARTFVVRDRFGRVTAEGRRGQAPEG